MPTRLAASSASLFGSVQFAANRSVVHVAGLVFAELEALGHSVADGARPSGDVLAQYLDPLIGTSVLKLVASAMEGGLPVSSARHNEATHIATATPLFAGDGELSGCSLVVMAPASGAETQLVEEGELVDRLLGVMPGICYVYDVTTQSNVFSSRQLTDLLGYGEGSVKAPGAVLELFHPDDLQTVLAGIGRWTQAEDGEVITTSYRVRTAKGDYRWMTDHASVFERDADGSVLTMAGTALDSTEEVLAKQRHEELIVELQQRSALETVGSLATGIAHDFNNILTVMHGFIDLLSSQNREIQEPLQVLSKTCEQGQTLAAQIVNYAKGATDEVGEFDLREVVESFASMVKSTLANGNVSIEGDDGPCVIRAQRAQIQQLLLNLFVNARQATHEKGDVVLGVETKSEGGKNGVLLSVRDTGVGMPPEVASKMCEPYFTTRADEGGSGIGMAVVRRVIDNHKGAFRVTSALNKGTNIMVWLPASQSPGAY